MTEDQIGEILRVCGEDWQVSDVPALWRKDEPNWAELHGAYQDKNGEWQI